MTDHWPCKYHLHAITAARPCLTIIKAESYSDKIFYQKVCQKVSKNDPTIPILMVKSELGETLSDSPE